MNVVVHVVQQMVSAFRTLHEERLTVILFFQPVVSAYAIVTHIFTAFLFSRKTWRRAFPRSQ